VNDRVFIRFYIIRRLIKHDIKANYRDTKEKEGKMKKILVALILVFTLLTSACTSTDMQNDSSEDAEALFFSVMFNNREETPYRSDWKILEEYKKLKNVTLDIKPMNDENYNNAIALALESGNIPDIILKCWPNEIESYAASGILLPFSDYEDQMPNYRSFIEKNSLEDELDKLRMKNGKYYILPGYKRKIQVQQWIYRKDVFDNNNLAIPATYDQLYDDLLILKSKYPESTPLTACWGGAHLFAMMGAGYGIPAGWNGNRYYNEVEDIWQFSPTSSNYKEMIMFLNKCYENGILDSQIFTQDENTFLEKLQDGRAFATVTWISSGFSNWNQKLIENGHANGEWQAFAVPESTVGIRALPAVSVFRKGLVVPARVINETYFEDLLKFLDWAVYSEEGMTLTSWGIEGLSYENTEAGKKFLLDIITTKNIQGTIDLSKEYGFNLIFNLNEDAEFEDAKKPDEISEFLKKSQERKELLELSPELKLNSQEAEMIRIIEEKLNTYAAEMQVKFIKGERDIEKEWDMYISECDERGYKSLEEIWNNAWE